MPPVGIAGFFAPALVLAICILFVAWDRTGGWVARGHNTSTAHLPAASRPFRRVRVGLPVPAWRTARLELRLRGTVDALS